MSTFRRVKFFSLIKEFQNLPKGMGDDELLKIVCEFKLGRFHNKDEFILAYTRLAVRQALQYAKHIDQADDLISVGLGALCNIPEEVHKGKLIDFNIVAYSMSRIRTKCIEYVRKDFVLATGYHAIKKGDVPLKRMQLFDSDKQDLVFNAKRNSLFKIFMAPSYVDDTVDIEDLLKKSIKTEGERLVVLYRRQGYTDKEIASIFGCSESQVRSQRTAVEQRYYLLKNKDGQ